MTNANTNEKRTTVAVGRHFEDWDRWFSRGGRSPA